MPDRNSSIKTADAELAATHEMRQAMRRYWSARGSIPSKQRAVLHMAMEFMDECVKVSDTGIWLQLK